METISVIIKAFLLPKRCKTNYEQKAAIPAVKGKEEVKIEK